MVSDLLDLEKLDSGTMKLDPTQVNIRSICQEAIETVSAEANRRDVELTLTSADIQVSADEKRILQVLVNLLSNAVKVAPTKTTVRVQAQVQDGLAKVSVIDQGPGIPKEDLTRVFERFSQVATPRAAPGIGLGLAICRSLVELHGGAIAVFNNEDAGACFSFTIPVQTAEPITALPQSPEPGI
jgi:signal transduction histidine kinase